MNWWEQLLQVFGVRVARPDNHLDNEIEDAERRLAEQERRLALFEELRVYRHKGGPHS